MRVNINKKAVRRRRIKISFDVRNVKTKRKEEKKKWPKQKKKKGTFLACGLGGGGRRGQTPEIKFKKIH